MWASMLKRMMVSERAAAWARQHGFDLQVEAIAQRDADSRRAFPMRGSCTHRPRLEPMPSPRRRRTLLCAHAR
jgi:hypothetical protein